MKPRLLSAARLSFALATALAALAAPNVQASTFYWDANGATAGLTDGAGAWLGANLWSSPTANSTWVSGSDAVFGIGGAGGAVTLASPTTVNSLTFNYFTGTYTLGTAGQTLTLGSGGITKNGGAGVATIISPVTLGAAQTWTNNAIDTTATKATNTLIVTGGVDNGGFLLTFDGAGTTSFTGTSNFITGAGGLTKNGTGALVLSAGGTTPAHNYSGTTTINGGVVRINSATGYGTGNLTINNGYLESYFGINFTRTLGSGTGQVQILGGVSGFSEQGSGSTVTLNNNSAFEVVWGAANEASNILSTGYFNPSTFVLQGDTVNAGKTIAFANKLDLNGTTRSIYVGQGSTTAATISGVIRTSSGTAGLTKTGAGNLILSAADTYNGDTTINAGLLTLSGSGTLASTSALNLGGGTLQLINTAQVNRFADVAVSVTAGGGVTYTNTSGANVYTESVGAVTVSGGLLNVVESTAQAGAGSQTLTFGTSGSANMTQSGTGSVAFSAASTGPQVSGNKNMIKVFGAGSTNASEVIGPWATVGTTAALQTDYAVYASDYVTGRATGATTSDATWSTTWGTTSNYNFANTTVGTTLTSTKNINTLQHTGGAETLTVASSANLGTYGILNASASLFTIAATGTGVVTLPTTSAGSLYVNTGSGAITINAPISNNTGALTLVKNGSAGTLILGAANNPFTGDIAVNAGTLQVGVSGSAAQLNSGAYAGNIFIGAGANLTLTGNSTNVLSGIISGDGTLTTLRGATTLSGPNTYTGKTTLGLVATNAVGNTTSISSFNSVFTDAGLGTVHSASSSLGAPTTVANGTIDFGGSVQITDQINYTGGNETTDRIINFVFNSSGARVIDVSGTAGSLLKFTSAFTSNGTTTGPINLQGTRNGEIVQGLPLNFSALNKSGAGTWTLGGQAGTTGTITVSGGTLNLNGNQNNTTDTISGGTLNLNGIVTGSAISTTSAGAGSVNQSSTGSIVGAASVSHTSTGTIVLAGTNTYTGTTTFPGVVTSEGNIVFQGMQALSPNTTLNMTHTGGVGGLGFFKILDDSATPASRSTVNITTNVSNTSFSSGIFVGNNGSANGGNGTGGTTGSTITLGNLTMNQTVAGNTSQNFNVTGANGYQLQINNLTLATLSTLTAWTATIAPTNTIVIGGNVTQTGPSTTVSAILALDGTASGNQINGNILQPGGGGAALKINMTNSGAWALNGTGNTFTGAITFTPTTTSAGTLSYASAAGTNAITFNTTTSTAALSYTGASPLTMSGAITASALTTGTITLDASGATSADTINYSNTSSLTAVSASTGTRNLILTGTNTGDNIFNGVVTNNSGAGGKASLTKNGVGTWVLTNTNTYSGTTSITNGTLKVNGTGSINNSAVTVNGGTFRYNSSVAYTGTLTYTSGTIGGTNLTGSLGGQTIGTGQTISPGNSPGTAATTSQTWAGGGSYVWEVNNAQVGGVGGGTAGADPGWDLETGSGTLTISATSLSKFNLLITSLDALNAAGLATNFNDASSYNWLIADFNTTVTTFAANAFNIDTTNFQNTFTGTFGVARGDSPGILGGDDSQIYLTYTAIPEPSSAAALIGGLGGLLLLRRRR